MKRAFLLLLCSVATTFTLAQNAPTVKEAKSACGPFNVNFHVDRGGHRHPLATAITGRAQVYIVEYWLPPGVLSWGFNPTIRVGMDGKWMGADQGNSYMFFTVAAGQHHLCVSTQSKITQPHEVVLYGFNAKPDQVYFFRVRMPDIGKTTGLLLDPLNIDEAQLLVAEYPHATSTANK